MTESLSLKDDLPPDPSPQIAVHDLINGRVVETTTSLIFKNFKSPMIRIDPKRLYAVTGVAQYDIVKGVVAKHGDGIVTPYNFEWRSSQTFLRINHKVDDGMTYVMLSEPSSPILAALEFASLSQWRFVSKTVSRPVLIEEKLTPKRYRWSIMARAVKGVTDWGWNVGYVATQFVVLENMVEVGTGQLGYGWQTTAVNGTSTA